MKRSAAETLDDVSVDHEPRLDRAHRIMMAHAARSAAWHTADIDAYTRARLENNKRSSYLGLLPTDMANAVLLPYLTKHGQAAVGVITSERPHPSRKAPLPCEYFSCSMDTGERKIESSSKGTGLAMVASYRLWEDDQVARLVAIAAGGPRRETYAFFGTCNKSAPEPYFYVYHRRLPSIEQLSTAHRRPTPLAERGLSILPQQAPMGPSHLSYITRRDQNTVLRISLAPEKDIALVTTAFACGSAEITATTMFTSLASGILLVESFPTAINCTDHAPPADWAAREEKLRSVSSPALITAHPDVLGTVDGHWSSAIISDCRYYRNMQSLSTTPSYGAATSEAECSWAPSHNGSPQLAFTRGPAKIVCQFGISWKLPTAALAKDEQPSAKGNTTPIINVTLPCEPGREPRETVDGVRTHSLFFCDNEFPARTLYSIHALTYFHFLERRDTDGSGAALPYCYCIVLAIDTKTGLRKPSVPLELPTEISAQGDGLSNYKFTHACLDARGNFVAVINHSFCSSVAFVMVWSPAGWLIQCQRLHSGEMAMPESWLVSPDGFLCGRWARFLMYFCLDEQYVDWDELEAEDERAAAAAQEARVAIEQGDE